MSNIKYIEKSGLICHRINKSTSRIEFCLVLKNYTQDFIRILLGRYNIKTLRINMLTKMERISLCLFDISELYRYYFRGSRYIKLEFVKSVVKKFDDYKMFRYGGDKEFKKTTLKSVGEKFTYGPNVETSMWEIPRGKIEKNESREKCALREFFEETTLEGAKIDKEMNPIMDYECFRTKKYKITYFVGSAQGNSTIIPINNNEISMACWMSMDNIWSLRMDLTKKKKIFSVYKYVRRVIYNNNYD